MTKKKAATKKAAPKKKDKITLKTDKNKPIKIELTLIIKIEQAAGTAKATVTAGGGLEAAAVPTKIGYKFDTNQITLISLEIEGKELTPPAKSGTITLDDYPAFGEINVKATCTGQGTGSLQLTYNGKNVFATAQDFVFTAGHGLINQKATLPQ